MNWMATCIQISRRWINDNGTLDTYVKRRFIERHNYSKDKVMHLSSLFKSQTLKLWLSFVAGVLANALLGPSEIFYIYANELQVIFDINKKQGLSDSIQIIISQKIVAKNFSSSNRGIIMAVMGESISIGMLLFSVIYYSIPSKKHRFQQLMIFLFFFSVFVYIFCFLFLREVHSETDYTNILPEDDSHEHSLTRLDVHSKDIIFKKTFLQIIKDPNYQLLAWLSTLAFATGSVLKTNLTVLSQVSGLSRFDSYIFIYVPVFSSSSGIIVGLLSDKLRQSITRLPFLLFSCVLQTLCSFSNIIIVQSKAFIVLSVVLTGTSLGSLYALVSSVVSEMFHIDNYNRNYGMIKGAHAVTTLLFQYLFGLFYDDNVSDFKLFCRGLHCTEMGYMMNTIISLIPVLLCVCLLKRTALKITK
ncbi:unnamed protein product [Mytilus coruscus]|uniref:Major facilitator superfamily (MFS) profile domain-containing protein n=1 Tax=Mytilus coruscus TaxID=42192 RepID=A0A6J8A3Z2_MYTCO|nr:unnamed protein product [Mytilus coruscus]